MENGMLETFDQLKGDIIETFARIIETVTKRRAVLLIQLKVKKKEYLKKQSIHRKEREELEKMIEQMTELSLKENNIIIVRGQQVIELEVKLEELEESLQRIKPCFNNRGLDAFLKEAKEFGSIRITDEIYENKKSPSHIVGKVGRKEGELETPHGLAIDKKGVIYVADQGNSRIQMFTAGGEFVGQFGDGTISRPYSIALYKKGVFVSDWGLKSISKFENMNFKLVVRSVVGTLDYPFGLTVSNEGEVLVADRNNHRVAVFNLELKLIREFGKGKLEYPCDVKIRLEQIFVADNNNNNNIHIFSQTGDLLKSFIKLENGFDYLFFTFDISGNIIITDHKDNSIQIFTKEGEKTHQIECRDFPTGVVVTKSSNIICANYSSVLYVY